MRVLVSTLGELSIEEAKLLKAQLARRVAELDDELVHTDKQALQRELHRDVDRLRAIEERLGAAVASGS